MALLDVAGLCAGYGDVPVLRGIDLSIPEGSITALIGANGAGKTTLLRTISGIIPAEAGTIRYDGRDIVGMPPQDIVRAGLVQVPEGRRLFSEMTVFENLLVGSSSPAARRKRDENLAMVLELFPKVRERAAQRAGTLSGGEQQMVAIARALMAAPRLLLLDETSLGLAPIVVDEIFVAVRRLAAQGLTILVVEQNTALALEVADHGYVLEQGRFAIQGRGIQPDGRSAGPAGLPRNLEINKTRETQMKRMAGFLLSTTVLLSAFNANAADAVKIGAVYALTGPGAVGGGDGMRGTELAIAQVNAAGGLKNHGGAQIELVKGDSQSKPINAVGETERLINQDKVVLVMGAATSNETVPLVPGRGKIRHSAHQYDSAAGIA